MTTYNGGKLIQETIDSIINQTYEDWELIIFDDCSTDDTYALAKRFTDDRRIRVYRNDVNQGISHTRNAAIDLANGEYIAATDQDDISLPARIETQVRFLDQNPKVALVATAAKELRDNKLRSVYKGEMRAHILAWRLYSRCSIVHSSICVRHDTLRKYKLRYENDYHYAEDFVLFHKLSLVGQINILPDELVVYRETPNNASAKHGLTMNTNGAAFLRQAFEQELGISASKHDIQLLWETFNTRAPAQTLDDLRTAGRLYAEALDMHCDARGLNKTQELEVRQMASQDWWRAVKAYCIARGQPAHLALHREIESLGSARLQFHESLQAYLRAWIKSIIRRSHWPRQTEIR